MSILTSRRALAPCVLILCLVGAQQALAQAPQYGNPTGSPPAPGYAARPGPANWSQQYPAAANAAVPRSAYPEAAYPEATYPDTRVAGRPAGAARLPDARVGISAPGSGQVSIPDHDFADSFIQLPGEDDYSPDSSVQLAGYASRASKSGGCDHQHGHYYGGDCATCSDQVCLFPPVAGLRFGGWVAQGLTLNFDAPNDRMNAPVLFNDRANDYQLNQVNLFIEKPVINDGYQWELGGRVDALFGTDARFLTVPGLEEHQDGTPKWNDETRDYGLAVPQAYLELAAPWLHGVSLKAGHFYSIAGYETAPAPQNFFYSHAYTYLYGEPFTHTGALLSARPNQRVAISAGYTKGWDVLESNSNEYGILASIKLTSYDNRTSLAATVHSGQDVTGVRSGGALIDEDRHFYSIVLQHQINDCLRYVFQHDFGYQEDAEVVVNTGPRTITFDEAKWYGINQYLIYDIDAQTTAALRVEWFRDQDQSRVAIPVKFNPGGKTFLGGNYIAVTGGLNWRPNSNLTIRPEVRWDYSDLKGNGAVPGGDAGVRAFGDAQNSSQITAAFDVIVAF